MPDGKTKADDVPDPALAAFELSARLVLAGRYEEALTATDEAARLYRERITDTRTGPLEALGAAASRAYVQVFRCEALSKLGRWEECLRTASEAVALSARSRPTRPSPRRWAPP
ncbi:hypothetical protein [Streptomyces sp. NPDC085540]|uniref:hypothetical protein n=1 Tax=Streptomyces sp. NPDC085540 TaxID=3365730 RepID=UPI0037D2D4AE